MSNDEAAGTAMSRGTVGYLSAAPRVSTRDDAEAGGPRSHVLGMIHALEARGWQVDRYIVGDRLPASWAGRGSEAVVSGGWLKTLAADLVRLGLGVIQRQRAWRSLGGRVDWIYERHALLQSLGPIFHQQGKPWVLETNAPLSLEARGDRRSLVLFSLARRMERQAYQRCDLVVTVTQALKNLLVTELGVPEAKVLVLPNAVDTTFFDPRRQTPERRFPGLTVGFVGTLYAWQGLDLLLEAVHELRREGMDVSLVVVGDGQAAAEWRQLTSRLGIEDHVIFTGRVARSEVPALLAGFDLGFSGQVELAVGQMYHSPLKIYEYLAMGKVVVASDFEGPRAAVTPGETGFLFRPGDREDLKQALRQAATSDLATLGNQARREAVEKHSWNARLDVLMPRIEALLSKSS